MLFFETQEIGFDLSLMKISYNLTKKKNKKWKVWKIFENVYHKL